MKIAPFKISPDERIQMIQSSLRCLGYGTASAALTLGVPIAIFLVVNVRQSARWVVILSTIWIPLYSLTLAVFSWRYVFAAKKAARGEWNPAASQLLWGRILSALGVLLSLLLIGFFLVLKLMLEE